MALILTLGLIGGAAMDHVGSADALAGSPYERQIVTELRAIKAELSDIKYNTGAVCQDASQGYLCKKF